MTSPPWQLYLFYGGLVGIGLSTHDVITLSTVARWFDNRRGTMTGLVKVGTGAGQFLMPLVAAALIATYGWRNAYVMIGSVSLILLVLLELKKTIFLGCSCIPTFVERI